MSTYNNFFIGIPIPENYTEEYKKVLAAMGKIDSKIKLNTTNYPHITILFMGRQDSSQVEAVKSVVDKNIGLLTEGRVKVGGFGYFKNKNYDVIYLNVEKNKKLEEFFSALRNSLNSLFASEKKNFAPHLTLARIKSKKIQEVSLRKLDDMLSTISWEFPVTKIKFYGRQRGNGNKQLVVNTFIV